VLLPAVMTVLGEANWYLPRWLRWLPTLGHGHGHGHEARDGEGGEPTDASPHADAVPV
jgi:RND superfamily putative drug exporter